MGSIEGKIQKGAAWMILFKLAERSLGLISIVILARLLIPEDFGLVAMAMSVVALLELFSAFGFDTAIIQNQSAERRHYDTAWTFNVLFGVFSTVTLLCLSIPVAQFYHESRLIVLMAVLAIGPLVRGFENIGVVGFRKELNFDQEFRFQILKKIVSFVVTVSLAIALRSYWALVAGIIVGQVVGVAISYIMHPYRPKFCLSASKDLMSFSKWLFLNNFISYFYRHSADFMVGRMLGASSLGVYSIGREIATLPTTELIAPINRAVFPGYAKISNDLERLQETFLKVLSAIALLALPAAAGIAVTAEPLVIAVLGEKWIEAVPVIQILAFYGAMKALISNTYYVHLALGKVRSFTSVIGISLVVLIPMLVVMTDANGVTGTAQAYLVGAIVFFPIFYWTAMKALKLEVSQLVKCVWRPIVSTTIMYAIVQMAAASFHDHHAINNLITLAGLILLGVVIYCSSATILWIVSGKPVGPEQFALTNISLILRRPTHQ